MGVNSDSTKYILDTPKGHHKPRINEKVVATAYKQLLQGDLGLPEYKEKCREVTVYDKCLQNVIVLGLSNQ